MDKREYNIDVFLTKMTHLPFRGVVNACQSNSKFRNFCTSSNYNNNWRALIDNTFGDSYGYRDKLEKIWKDLNYQKDRYDYMVYSNLVKYLDTITQLMIYYRQDDMDSFNDPKYNNTERFVALFLLRDRALVNYLPEGNIYQEFMRLYNGETLDVNILSRLLRLVSQLRNVRIVKYLVEHGANINQGDGDDGNTPVILASEEGHLEIVKYLVEQGANVDHVNNDGYTPLISASYEGHLEIVKYLVEHGADVNQANNDAWTSLIWVSFEGHLEIVKYLVEHGANVNQADNDGRTPFFVASQRGHLEIVRYLEEHGAI